MSTDHRDSLSSDPEKMRLWNHCFQKAGRRVDDPFGGCPICGGSDLYHNVGREHWVTCETHKTRWHIGSNLFSHWREEPESQWEANRRKLLGYREVDPIFFLRDRQYKLPGYDEFGQ